MRSFGIGAAGNALISHAGLAACLALLVSLAAVYGVIFNLRFNGDVTEVLRVDSPGHNALERVETEFHPFSTDEVIVVEAHNLGDPDSYQALEFFVSELSLVTGVDAALSIFSLPAGRGDATEPWLGTRDALALPPGDRLNRFLDMQPFASDMLSTDLTTTLIVLMIAQDGVDGGRTVLSDTGRTEIEAAIAAHAPHLTVSFGGLGEVNRTIEASLQKDQQLLATVSTLICVLLSLAIFRSWRSALICAVPPLTGALWFFGFAAAAGLTIDPITTIIPTLLIVVGFADSVHLYFSFLREHQSAGDVRAALGTAIEKTGPACFMTSMTTAITCLGIGLAGSNSLQSFASGGFAGLIIQFLALIVVFPLMALLLAPRAIPDGGARKTGFGFIARMATSLLAFSRPVLLLGLILFAVLAYAQTHVVAGFSLSEHLRDDTTLKQLEARLTEKSLGSAQIFVVLDDPDGERGISDADTVALRKAAEAIYSAPGGGETGNRFLTSAQLERLQDEDHPLARRFVSRDGMTYLLPVAIDPAMTAAEITSRADAIANRLEAAGLEQRFEIAGLPLLSARQVPDMISDLRLGFYLALVLVVALLIYATGSVRLGLVSLIPNLIPILGVESYMAAAGQQLNMTASVALTVAFGIAIDNTIHVLNAYQRSHDPKGSAALMRAVGQTAPPIAATTALLVAGLMVTQMSSLPTVAVFGQLVCAALALAMVSALFILPAFVTLAERRRWAR